MLSSFKLLMFVAGAFFSSAVVAPAHAETPSAQQKWEQEERSMFGMYKEREAQIRGWIKSAVFKARMD